MGSIQNALGYYITDSAINSITSLGSSSIVYVSIPDPSATTTAGDQCQGLNLLSLPSGYTYHCAASSTFRNVNGQGWIPVNLSTMTEGAVLPVWPTDPTNSSSSRLYYTYTTNGTQFEVTTPLESQKYKLGGSNDVVGTDGGTLATVYERGTRLGLEPLDYGDSSLVGLWTFDEGTGTIAYDYSGNGNSGSWNGTAAGTSGYYSAGKVGNWAGYFNGTNNYVSIPNTASIDVDSGNFTVTAWFYLVNQGSTYNYATLFGKGASTGWPTDYFYSINSLSTNDQGYSAAGGTAAASWYGGPGYGPPPVIATSTWEQVAMVCVPGNGQLIYLNGAYWTTGHICGTTDGGYSLKIGADPGGIAGAWYGSIDDVRVYNRVLSASEIQAMYNGGK